MMWRASFLALLLTGACGGSEPLGATRTWVGHLDGTDAALAITLGDSKLAAYVCGGPSTLKTLTHWMSGDKNDQQLSASHPDGTSLIGNLEAGAATGVLKMAGFPDRSFSARAIRLEFGRTLRRQRQRLPNRRDRLRRRDRNPRPSVIGAWCDSGGSVSEVTPIAPVAMREDGLQVEADGPEGHRMISVRPVRP